MTTTLSELNLVDTKNELKNLQNIYQALTGTSIEQIEQSFGENAEELSIAIAQVDVGKDMAEAMYEFYENYGQNEAARELINILNKSDTELALSGIDTTSVDTIADHLGLEPDELEEYAKAAGQGGAVALQEALNERLDKGSIKLNNLIPNIDGQTVKQYLDSLSEEDYEIAISLIEDGESFKSFEDFINTVSVKKVQVKISGLSGDIENLSSGLNQIIEKGDLSDFDETELNAFTSALEQLPAIYYENTTAAKEWEKVSKQGLLSQIDN